MNKPDYPALFERDPHTASCVLIEDTSDCKEFTHCKKIQVVSTNYYLVTSSTEILRSVNF